MQKRLIDPTANGKRRIRKGLDGASTNQGAADANQISERRPVASVFFYWLSQPAQFNSTGNE